MRTFYTAIVTFLFISLSLSAKAHTLPSNNFIMDAGLNIQKLAVSYDATKKVNTINWVSKNSSEINYFIVESSSNGVEFKTIGYVFAGEVENYTFKSTASDKVSYKVLAVDKNDNVISVSTN